jgi:hypothetical protein
MKRTLLYAVLAFVFFACKKDTVSRPPGAFNLITATVDNSPGSSSNNILYFVNVRRQPVVEFSFSAPINRATVGGNILFFGNGTAVNVNYTFSHQDSTIAVQPVSPLQALSTYMVTVSIRLQSAGDSSLKSGASLHLVTVIDSTDKFPRISDSALLTLVEQKTFAYFWDFGHPVSGLARERNTSADVVTTGGSGFGVMSMLVGIQRNFISRAEGLGRVQTILNFLSTKAQRYHGAFPHWLNGVTGATVPFSTEDDGADLVETSYLMQGLLTARQFFNSTTDPTEIAVRDSINSLWNGVQWSWFRQGGQNTLYWHWSPDYNWSTGQQVNGWNEALITYVLAASSPTDSIPKIVYDNGWALNGAIRNGKTFYGIQLPLGPDYGGPLFFAHYSFLGINPNGLSDAYANYWTQDTAHARINYDYCVANPHNYSGYSNLCWGLTASDDDQGGYAAHSPTLDVGVITPTAAISSMPYTPVESMNALRFFYYTLGDKLWGQYGFVDAFDLGTPWFAPSYLAIDQGPEIVMIENYRSGLLWNLFMSCPEIKRGMTNLGFQGPNL